MKRNRKTGNQPLPLQEKALASVCGGGISEGGRVLTVVDGGIAPADDGVIHSRN